MNETKQVKEQNLVKTLQKYLKDGKVLKHIKYNGQPSEHKYVKLTFN